MDPFAVETRLSPIFRLRNPLGTGIVARAGPDVTLSGRLDFWRRITGPKSPLLFEDAQFYFVFCPMQSCYNYQEVLGRPEVMMWFD